MRHTGRIPREWASKGPKLAEKEVGQEMGHKRGVVLVHARRCDDRFCGRHIPERRL